MCNVGPCFAENQKYTCRLTWLVYDKMLAKALRKNKLNKNGAQLGTMLYSHQILLLGLTESFSPTLTT